MTIETPSRRLARAARICRWFPPVISGRLLQMLYPFSLAEREDVPFQARSSLGDLTFAYDRAAKMAHAFAVRGFYEWRNIVIANTLCRPGDTIIDVGANFGTETIHFALVVGKTGNVVAFEPLPEAYEVLKSAVERNNLTQVSLNRKAVAAQAGTFAFTVPVDERNLGTGSLLAAEKSQGEKIEVEVLVLDDLYAAGEFQAPRLIVMDVEGVELDVLRGASRILEDSAPTIVMEVNPPLLKQRDESPQTTANFFAERDYACYQISSWGLRQPDMSDRIVNWVCIAQRHDPHRTARRLTSALRRAALLPLWRGLNPAVVGGNDRKR
ncbi:MAG: FkbM family methyltransferase [Planctomycetota bacterium]|nr:MAG: FkbM family methyltransferase [Planctomycetota bacterium]